MIGATIPNAWGDGRDASVSNDMCFARSCLRIGEDKGTYSPGRGYTSYYKNPKLVCMTRHCNGCPTPMPEPDPERVRCCPHPDLPKPRGKPLYQTCRTCNTRHDAKRLPMVRQLEKHEYSPCPHPEKQIELSNWRLRPAYKCHRCRLWFKKARPQPYEKGLSHQELLALEARMFQESLKANEVRDGLTTTDYSPLEQADG